MGFFFCVFIAIVAYIGYRVYRHPYEAQADPADPAYKDEFRTLCRELLTAVASSEASETISTEDSNVFEDKLAMASSVSTARSAGSRSKLPRTPPPSASREAKSGKRLRQ